MTISGRPEARHNGQAFFPMPCQNVLKHVIVAPRRKTIGVLSERGPRPRRADGQGIGCRGETLITIIMKMNGAARSQNRRQMSERRGLSGPGRSDEPNRAVDAPSDRVRNHIFERNCLPRVWREDTRPHRSYFGLNRHGDKTALDKSAYHRCLSAPRGQAVVEAAADFRPDVILLDIGMLKLSGYEACGRIRALPGGKAAHIVAVTGWGQQNDRARSRQAGFDGHLVKPIEPATLEKLLAELSSEADKSDIRQD